jgi:hypothetical protein
MRLLIALLENFFRSEFASHRFEPRAIAGSRCFSRAARQQFNTFSAIGP